MDALEAGHIHILRLATEGDEFPVDMPFRLVRVPRQPAPLVRPVDFTPQDRAHLIERRGAGNNEGIAGRVRAQPPSRYPASEEALARPVAGRDSDAAVIAHRFGNLPLARPQKFPQDVVNKAARIISIAEGDLALCLRRVPPREFGPNGFKECRPLRRAEGCRRR